MTANNEIQVSNTTIDKLMDYAIDDSAAKDFEFARANIKEIIVAGKNAIEQLGSIAESSQEPRAYEVLAKLIDSVSKASKDLLEAKKKIIDINMNEEPIENNKDKNTTNNFMFIGTTNELQRMLIEAKKDKNNIIDIELEK